MIQISPIILYNLEKYFITHILNNSSIFYSDINNIKLRRHQILYNIFYNLQIIEYSCLSWIRLEEISIKIQMYQIFTSF